MSSVNIAGSRLLAPYTVVVDFTTRCCSPGAFWHAARSCIVPMTLSSFIVPRPPALPGVGDDAHVDDGVDVLLGDHLGDHRVADVGADERDVADVAARRDDVDADDPVDGRVGGERAREPAPEVSRDPGDQDDLAGGCPSALPSAALLAELATLDARLLQQLAVLLLRHALAPLLDDRTHENLFRLRPVRDPGRTPGRPATAYPAPRVTGTESAQPVGAAAGPVGVRDQPAL